MERKRGINKRVRRLCICLYKRLTIFVVFLPSIVRFVVKTRGGCVET